MVAKIEHCLSLKNFLKKIENVKTLNNLVKSRAEQRLPETEERSFVFCLF